MKISEIITEEMVEAVYKSQFSHVYDKYSIQITKDSIAIDFNSIGNAEMFCLLENGRGVLVNDKVSVIDLARFLFVDAWDYFEKKRWVLMITLYNTMGDIIVHKYEDNRESPIVSKAFLLRDYPSRLHAMAAAVKFMWEQEGNK